MNNPNKFTPGPWTVYTPPEMIHMRTVICGPKYMIKNVLPQDAALIAAAPELLEALIDVKMLLNGDATNFDMLRDDVLNHVSRLIAKATGGAE